MHPDDFVVYTGGELLVAGLVYWGDAWIGSGPPEKGQEVESLFAKIRGTGEEAGSPLAKKEPD